MEISAINVNNDAICFENNVKQILYLLQLLIFIIIFINAYNENNFQQIDVLSINDDSEATNFSEIEYDINDENKNTSHVC